MLGKRRSHASVISEDDRVLCMVETRARSEDDDDNSDDYDDYCT